MNIKCGCEYDCDCSEKENYNDFKKDAERYRFLRNNNLFLCESLRSISCYRSTLPTARKEKQMIREGWFVGGETFFESDGVFDTMDQGS